MTTADLCTNVLAPKESTRDRTKRSSVSDAPQADAEIGRQDLPEALGDHPLFPPQTKPWKLAESESLASLRANSNSLAKTLEVTLGSSV